MIRKFKDYNEYYSRTYADVWTYGRYCTCMYMKRIKPKTNALILKQLDGTETILASGFKGINKYLRLHPDTEISL